MGGVCFGATFRANQDVAGQGLQTLRVAEALGIGRSQVNRIFNQFRKCDAPHPGTMTFNEFKGLHPFPAEWCGEMAFNAPCFPDVDHEIDFQTFMIILWNMCTLDAAQIARLVFRYFKHNSGNTMEAGEVDNMVDHLIGHKKEKSAHVAFKALLPVNINSVHGYGDFTENQFVDMCHKSSAIMFYPFEIQRVCRLSVLGSKKWIKIAKFRRRVYSDRDVTDITFNIRNKNLTKDPQNTRVLDGHLIATVAEAEKKSQKQQQHQQAEKPLIDDTENYFEQYYPTTVAGGGNGGTSKHKPVVAGKTGVHAHHGQPHPHQAHAHDDGHKHSDISGKYADHYVTGTGNVSISTGHHTNKHEKHHPVVSVNINPYSTHSAAQSATPSADHSFVYTPVNGSSKSKKSHEDGVDSHGHSHHQLPHANNNNHHSTPSHHNNNHDHESGTRRRSKESNDMQSVSSTTEELDKHVTPTHHKKHANHHQHGNHHAAVSPVQ